MKLVRDLGNVIKCEHEMNSKTIWGEKCGKILKDFFSSPSFFFFYPKKQKHVIFFADKSFYLFWIGFTVSYASLSFYSIFNFSLSWGIIPFDKLDGIF